VSIVQVPTATPSISVTSGNKPTAGSTTGGQQLIGTPPGLYPDPDAVTEVAPPPLVGLTLKVDVTRKFAVKESPKRPLINNVYPGGARPGAVDLTVKVHPEAMFPNETPQFTAIGEKSSGGPPTVVIWTEESPELNADPVTVTTVPVGPVYCERVTIGPPVTRKAVDAVGLPAAPSQTVTT
jgi:hypothetical protein